MPRLWTDTIAAHRTQVRDAILNATAELVAEHGLRSVTMSRIAERAGIGRATLYKYFPDVEAILHAWHERQIAHHLDQLTELRDRAGDPDQRLAAVLQAYALITHERGAHDHPGPDIAALLHRGAHVARAQRRIHDLVEGLLAEAARAGRVRTDVAPGELASYCIHAIGAAGDLRSAAAIRRLVTVVLAGLRPTPSG